MSTTTVIPVSDDVLDILHSLGEEPERVVLETMVYDLFRRGELSRGRGAQILGIDLLTFMREASARGIPVIGLHPADFDADLDRARNRFSILTEERSL